MDLRLCKGLLGVMMIFADIVKQTKVNKGNIAIFFLGQAGFILKDSQNHLIAYDPYLSDCCNRFFGFKRLMPYLLKPDELVFDCVICSHGHYDHLDPDSVGGFLNNDKTKLYTTQDGISELEKLGIHSGVKIECGDEIQLPGEFEKARFVFCDHGKLAPDAVGTVISVAGKKLYFAGDTAYRPDRLLNEYTMNCDFAALPINGKFGNMNEEEAATIAKKIASKMTVPCHYWNFAEHGGNPAEFIKHANEICIPFTLMRQGECIYI